MPPEDANAVQNDTQNTVKTKRARPEAVVIGWREIVDLPDLGLIGLHAKIDTGARTTALHARKIRLFDEDGTHWVEFLPPRVGAEKPVPCRCPVHDEREIKNTSGIPEKRIIIRSTLVIAGRRWKIELSLSNRSNMAHPIIIGRSAISRHHLLVDSGRSYSSGNPRHLPQRNATR